MEWTDESIMRLRGLWQDGLSTAEIGRRMQITKNAVVGKAHRLTLPPRPSPIRKSLELASTGLQPQRAVLANSPPSSPQPPRPAPPRAAAVTEIRAAAPASVPVPAAAEPVPANVQPLRPLAADAAHETAAPIAPVRPAARPAAEADDVIAPVLRTVSATPRRRGLTCCWPLGDPGTKDFTFCGGDPMSGKPYCAAHAALAYVKIRDRRDNVA